MPNPYTLESVRAERRWLQLNCYRVYRTIPAGEAYARFVALGVVEAELLNA